MMEMIPYPDVDEDSIYYIDLAEMNCEFNPVPIPLGMFHCPSCGEMVVGGIPHPDYSVLDNLTEADFEGYPDRDGAGDDEC